MPGIGIGLSSAFGTKPLFYLLRDEFTSALAAGSVHGTDAEPGPGTRVVTDTAGSKLAVSGGNLVITARTAAGDPGYWLDSVARAVGRLVIGHVNLDVNSLRVHVGWDANQAGTASAALAFVNVSGNFRVSGQDLITIIGGRDYFLSLVLRAGGSGAFAFVKEANAFPTWTLVWHNEADGSDPLYPTISVQNTWSAGNDANFDFLRVPDILWLPAPLVSDGFADDNDTSLDAHSTDGLGHPEGVAGDRGSGGDGYIWTEESGDWDVQSNRANPDGAAIASVDAGDADVLIDCTVNGGAADQPAIMLRWLDTSNYWYLQADRANNLLELHEYNATVDTVRASAAVTIDDSTDYDLRAIAYGQNIEGYLDEGNQISYGSAALNETKTEHGIRAENTAGQFDDFVIYARDGYGALSGF